MLTTLIFGRVLFGMPK